LKTQSIGRLTRKLEPAIVVFLFLFYLAPNVSPSIETALRYANYIALLAIFAGLIGQWQQFAYVATRDIFPWLLVGISLTSVLWSAAPEFTIEEVDSVIRASIFGAYLTMRYTLKEQIQLIAWTFGIAAVLSIVFAIGIPSYGIDESGLWRGIFKHKQALGRLMPIGIITFLNIALHNRKYRWIALAGVGLSIALLLLAQSITGLLVLLISLSLLPLFKLIRQHYKLRVVLLVAAFLLISGVAMLITTNLETIVVDILGKDLTFNGRIPIWTLAIEKGLERPWLGYGYDGFWTSDESYLIYRNTWLWEGFVNGEIMHAHNGFIDIFLELGFVGLSLCLLSFLMLISRTFYLINLTNLREFFWIFQFLIIFLFCNMSEGAIFLGGSLFWVLYVSMSFSTAIWCNRIKKNTHLLVTKS
jgi:O-antigen ligase